jgi:hypothetical protein
MKTIIENSINQSKYIFEDNVEITQDLYKTITPAFIIGDLNSSNSTLIENVTPPTDWVGCKYLFVNNTWELNPDYIEVTNV